MKIIILFFGFSYILLNIVIAQSGSLFPIDSTSKWRTDHIRNGVSDENTHIPGDEIFKYFINGDTVINLKTYHKIYKTGTSYLDGPTYYENVYAGALKDYENKFYFIKKNENDEVLLYDFNAKIDDTIQVPYDGIMRTKIVSSIDSLPDGRKQVHFNPKEPVIGCGDQFIIEGIGGSGGLLEGPACGHYWTFDNHLVCYVQNGEVIYHDTNNEFNCELTNNQDINKSIDTNGVWRIDKQHDTDSISNFEKFKYFFCGDTTIGPENYLKLYKSGFQLIIKENGEYISGINDSVYVGALRQNNQKIYFIDKGKPEVLLYNFGLEADDIIDGQIFHGDTVKLTDTILDDRKALYLSDRKWEKKIISGIGTEMGLLENKTENSILICYMKGYAALYCTNSVTDCNLSYESYNFNDCDKLKLIPENPTTNDEIKLVSRSCYNVSSKTPTTPTLSDKTYQNDGYNINLDIYFDYDKKLNAGSINIINPIFDTTIIGYLDEGGYSIDQAIHTIYKYNNQIDTAFSEKTNFLYFTVSKTNSVAINKAINDQFKIYPVPSNQSITIENLNINAPITSIEIFSILGSRIETNKLDNAKSSIYKIDVSALIKGIYLISININNSCITKRVIVE